jgi:hypothetical protein
MDPGEPGSAVTGHGHTLALAHVSFLSSWALLRRGRACAGAGCGTPHSGMLPHPAALTADPRGMLAEAAPHRCWAHALLRRSALLASLHAGVGPAWRAGHENPAQGCAPARPTRLRSRALGRGLQVQQPLTDVLLQRLRLHQRLARPCTARARPLRRRTPGAPATSRAHALRDVPWAGAGLPDGRVARAAGLARVRRLHAWQGRQPPRASSASPCMAEQAAASRRRQQASSSASAGSIYFLSVAAALHKAPTGRRTCSCSARPCRRAAGQAPRALAASTRVQQRVPRVRCGCAAARRCSGAGRARACDLLAQEDPRLRRPGQQAQHPPPPLRLHPEDVRALHQAERHLVRPLQHLRGARVKLG